MNEQLSIIIPTRNEDMLGFTLEQIAATRGKTSVEVIVVDDGSGQEVQGVQGINLQIIRRQQPVGLDNCRDAGILAAGCDQVLILDAHMNFHDGDWAANPWVWVVEFRRLEGGAGC